MYYFRERLDFESRNKYKKALTNRDSSNSALIQNRLIAKNPQNNLLIIIIKSKIQIKLQRVKCILPLLPFLIWVRKFSDSQSNQIVLLRWVLPGGDKTLSIIYQDSSDWPPPPFSTQFQLSQLFLFCLLLELVRTLSPMAIETAAVKYSSSSWPWPNKRFLMAQIMLRILAIAFSLAAISLMITNTQTVLVFLVQMKATYSSSSAWR